MIVGRAGRALQRLWRSAAPAATAVVPLRRWADELSEAGVTPADWVDKRRQQARLYSTIPDACVRLLPTSHPDLTQKTINAARRVLGHEFNLLGSGPYVPIDTSRPTGADGYRPIDWYFDPVSGLRFPPRIPLAQWNLERMRPGRADIKLPWELARCQHWPMLGQAYRLTGDDQFALEIVRELHDFVEANPIGTAVNWACTMDVGLRAANWAIGLEQIQGCSTVPPSFWLDAHEALFDHGVFIESHLENTYEVTSNHFLSNVVGLFYLAAVFRDLPHGIVWDRQCRAWLSEEMDIQVLPDGADFESSIPYHRLVTELFLGSAWLADHSGQPLSSALLTRLRLMVDFLAAVLRPDGLMPQVGDADDGRLHVLSGYGCRDPQDPRHVFAAAGSVFRTNAWASLRDEWTEWEAAWWGRDAADSVITDRVATGPAVGVQHFPNAGVTVMRQGPHYLLITNGVVGTNGFGNHKHNDLLGFELHVDGNPVVVDPGSYVYTSDPDARNLFRSTRSHNTVSVDEEEQNEVKPGPEWIFRTFQKATPEHLTIGSSAGGGEYCGRHSGYARLRHPLMHERTFWLDDAGALVIHDVLESHGPHRLRWHFHFAPGVQIDRDHGSGHISIAPFRTGSAGLVLIAAAGLESHVIPAWYSPSYGVRVQCTAVEFSSDQLMTGRHEYRFDIRRC